MGRTRLLRLATRLGQDRLYQLERHRRDSPPLRALSKPVGWWLRRGYVNVAGGPGAGIRLSLAHLPLTHAQSGALARGWVEIEVQEAMRRLLRPGDTVVDVGANIGFFSLLAARLVGPQGRVYAVEPAPENVAAIRANTELNGVANVEAVEVAAGAAAGRSRLLVVEDQSWSMMESQGDHPLGKERIEVEVAPVDDLVGQGRIAPPRLVKIDVEGAEPDVLRGARRTLAEHRPAVICELHGTNEPVAEALEAAGYELTNLEGPDPVREAAPDIHVLGLPQR